MKPLKNELTDRNLRFDGVSEIEPDQLARFLLLGIPPSKLRINGTNDDIIEFNTQVSANDQLLPISDESIDLDMEWQLPEEYKQLDLQEHMAEKFEQNCPVNYTPEQVELALDRIVDELHEIKSRGMVEFMQTIIFVIDQLRKHNVVWGVGRGSSCASYLLFLVGLHVVDCIVLEVSSEEFFHD